MKAHPTTSEYVLATKAIAVINSIEGFTSRALKTLSGLAPFLRYTEPFVYFDYLNSYTVELGHAGRLYEARNISDLVLASPFAFAYPEWRETAQELRPASRSFAAIEPSKIGRAKLLQMPKIEHGEPSELYRPASVVHLQDWKTNMGKKKKTAVRALKN